jgi:outer membrane protein assembly factor BamD
LSLLKLNSLYKFFFLLAAVALVSCDGFNRLVKSSDYELKLKRADEYYAKENYVKATQLYMELLPIYKGTPTAEEIYYHYTYCNYNQGDYGLAQYYFKDFVRQFPASVHAEECYFMNAYCYFLNSPHYTLDQTDTKSAIKEFQSFVDAWPESARIDTCNSLIDKLRSKLEKKDYDIVKQYFRLTQYKAAITAAELLIKEFPESNYVEEMYYLMVDSYYLLASNSIPSKKMERLNGAIETYLKFVDLYPKSNYLGRAEDVYSSCTKLKEDLIKKEKNGF